MDAGKQITVMEREQLSRAIRMREKVAKSELRARGSKALADFEVQLQAEYSYNDDAVWKEAMEKVQPIAAEAQRIVAERSHELGIPKRFAPSLGMGWNGKAAAKSEYADLRRLASTRIDAKVARGLVTIETEAARLQVELISGAIQSVEGKAFLERIPSADSLIPALGLGELKKLLSIEQDEDRARNPWKYRE
jgi:hypothetical protein